MLCIEFLQLGLYGVPISSYPFILDNSYLVFVAGATVVVIIRKYD